MTVNIEFKLIALFHIGDMVPAIFLDYGLAKSKFKTLISYYRIADLAFYGYCGPEIAISLKSAFTNKGAVGTSYSVIINS